MKVTLKAQKKITSYFFKEVRERFFSAKKIFTLEIVQYIKETFVNLMNTLCFQRNFIFEQKIKYR